MSSGTLAQATTTFSLVDITRVHYKVLDAAYDGESIGHLLLSVTEHPRHGEPFQAHPETTIEDTSAALVDLLGGGLLELSRSGEEVPLPHAEAAKIASDPTNWIAPLCWEYESSLTPEGEAALLECEETGESDAV